MNPDPSLGRNCKKKAQKLGEIAEDELEVEGAFRVWRRWLEPSEK